MNIDKTLTVLDSSFSSSALPAAYVRSGCIARALSQKPRITGVRRCSEPKGRPLVEGTRHGSSPGFVRAAVICGARGIRVDRGAEHLLCGEYSRSQRNGPNSSRRQVLITLNETGWSLLSTAF